MQAARCACNPCSAPRLQAMQPAAVCARVGEAHQDEGGDLERSAHDGRLAAQQMKHRVMNARVLHALHAVHLAQQRGGEACHQVEDGEQDRACAAGMGRRTVRSCNRHPSSSRLPRLSFPLPLKKSVPAIQPSMPTL